MGNIEDIISLALLEVIRKRPDEPHKLLASRIRELGAGEDETRENGKDALKPDPAAKARNKAAMLAAAGREKEPEEEDEEEADEEEDEDKDEDDDEEEKEESAKSSSDSDDKAEEGEDALPEPDVSLGKSKILNSPSPIRRNAEGKDKDEKGTHSRFVEAYNKRRLEREKEDLKAKKDDKEVRRRGDDTLPEADVSLSRRKEAKKDEKDARRRGDA